jgi:hypothetical protein
MVEVIVNVGAEEKLSHGEVKQYAQCHRLVTGHMSGNRVQASTTYCSALENPFVKTYNDQGPIFECTLSCLLAVVMILVLKDVNAQSHYGKRQSQLEKEI